MGWHDALAVKMAEVGKTSAEFRAGARRKAGATLLLLIAAGAVGYFMGWAWALFSRRRGPVARVPERECHHDRLPAGGH